MTSPTLTQVLLSPFSSCASPAQRDEADLKLDLPGLELKLHKVHFAVKFSEAEAPVLFLHLLSSIQYSLEVVH